MDKRNITKIGKCRAPLSSIHRQMNFNAICSRVLMEALRNILVVAWVFTLYNVRTSVKRRKQNQCEKTLPLLLLCPKKVDRDILFYETKVYVCVLGVWCPQNRKKATKLCGKCQTEKYSVIHMYTVPYTLYVLALCAFYYCFVCDLFIPLPVVVVMVCTFDFLSHTLELGEMERFIDLLRI